MLGAGLDKVDPCWAPNGSWRHFHHNPSNTGGKLDAFFSSFFLCRTLPGKHLDKIADQFRIHNINALLVIGGFEVGLIVFTYSLFLCRNLSFRSSLLWSVLLYLI